MNNFKGVGIGAGYFSHFQYEAWNRIPEVKITAICNRDIKKAAHIMEQNGIMNHYTDYKEMIIKERPDFVDIITPPDTHLEICKFAAENGVNIICQKPLAPTFEESQQIVKCASDNNVRFVVHENWRFQPWYREIKKLLNKNTIGNIHTVYFRSRMGDGWGENAYMPRQPYFREYPRFLVFENGIHFIDTYRFLFGEIKEVYAILRKINPIINGEDCAQVILKFRNDILGIWDANRYNEPNYPSPRYTFGELLAEGDKGSIRLYGDGNITVSKLGEEEKLHNYYHENINFSGDCVYNFQRHFVDCMISGEKFETNGQDYLKSLLVQEAVYKSSEINLPETIERMN